MTAIIYKEKAYSYQVVEEMLSLIAPSLEKVAVDNVVALMLSDPFEMAICVLASFRTNLKMYLLHPSSPTSRVDDLIKKNIPVVKHISDLPRTDITLSSTKKHTCSLIFSTSNTTSNVTRWVEIPGEYMIRKAEMLLEDLQIKKTDCTYLISSFCFIQSCWTLIVHLMAGGTVWIDNFSVESLRTALYSGNVTTFVTVPSIARTLVSDITNIGSLRLIVLGGDFADKELIEALALKWPTLYFANVYGCTETSAADLILNPTMLGDNIEECYTLGKPGRYSTVRVLDIETKKDVARGTVGCIWIKGPFVTKHYLGVDALVSDDELGFCTNDFAFIDGQGRFCFYGRNSSLIKYNGCKVSALEIEHILNKLEGVLESIVLGEDHKIYGQIPIGYLHCEKNLQKRDIVEHLVQYIETYKIPKRFYVVSSVPKTISGKMRRNKEVLKNNIIKEIV